MKIIEIGEKAPDFAIPNQNGDIRNLKRFEGKWFVIYFYPRDDTPGCTVEAKEFTDLNQKFEKQGCVVVGISPDNEAKHCKFIEKHELNIELLADNDIVKVELLAGSAMTKMSRPWVRSCCRFPFARPR